MPQNTLKKVTVDAKTQWIPVGVKSSPDGQISIRVVGGGWTPNPSYGEMFDGNGHPDSKAGSSYVLEGAPEGGLIARVGRELYFIGNLGYIPASETPTDIELIINDELEARSGAGFNDNQGSLEVEIAYAASLDRYRIASADKIESLEQKVNDLVSQGFEPVSGVTAGTRTVNSVTTALYMQTMWRSK
jgi:hypothetical protein